MKSIDYANLSWNPFTGCDNWRGTETCNLGERCWAKSMSNRLAGRYGYDKEEPFKPTMHETQLNRPLHIPKSKRIACCFMGDVSYATSKQFGEIMYTIREANWHRFFMLSKRPSAVNELYKEEWPSNLMFGVSVGTYKAIRLLIYLKKMPCKMKWVSFEPLTEDLDTHALNLEGIDFVAIGGLKTSTYSYSPPDYYIDRIVRKARLAGVPVYIKNNISESIREKFSNPRELPEAFII